MHCRSSCLNNFTWLLLSHLLMGIITEPNSQGWCENQKALKCHRLPCCISHLLVSMASSAFWLAANYQCFHVVSFSRPSSSLSISVQTLFLPIKKQKRCWHLLKLSTSVSASSPKSSVAKLPSEVLPTTLFSCCV